ncbi:colanic biosynthesis UDP-glucose lipid carrier transferase [Paramagnetospirillum caucaseum]|uniref:Colanic biosynthesis UDP-glucose lipid carrier transferase n=1 Tax=Paramagnetospirillum caucaseum TaxID=1244869 RepID=M3AEK4_9PROT|nr:exopolysaccharide biosynthesis polyprenyl glycosylphosphotransferase [Paramagnetospirillum caucaseum]EME71268.1 colanic biosynthesis UDP-glucose lipid carrier transferase [Paramagnetospirillum caucaseum]
MLIGLVKLFDIVAILMGGGLAFVLRHGSLSMSPLQTGLLLISPPVLSFWFHVFGAYSSGRILNSAHSMNALAIGGLAGGVTLMTLGYATKTSGEFSRVWLMLWVPLSLLLLVFGRAAIGAASAHLKSAGIGRRRIAIIGRMDLIETIRRRIDLTPDGTDIVAVVALSLDSQISDHVAALRTACADTDPHGIVVAVGGQDISDVERMIVDLSSFDTDIDLFLEYSAIRWPFETTDTLAGMPVLRVMNRPWRGVASVLKAIEDRVGAVVLLVVLAPLMGLIAAAIKLDSSGPILYAQRRSGWRDREFTVYKFRTMRHDPTEQVMTTTIRNDPRVTRIGRLLRRTSLDELPQLFNVLTGSMSLVGPRPHEVFHSQGLAAITDSYLWRTRVRPGMTGWAQVNGCRGEITSAEDLEQRIAYDLFYIENWSIMFDVMILARSLALCFRDSKAY